MTDHPGEGAGLVVLRGWLSNSAPPLLERAIRAYRRLDLTHVAVPVRRQLPKRARRLNLPERDLLVQRYEAGATVYELAAEFHIARATAASQLKAAGITLRNSPLTQDEKNRAIELYAAGLSSATIGKQLGRDHAAIWRALRAAGVRMRDTHGRSASPRPLPDRQLASWPCLEPH